MIKVSVIVPVYNGEKYLSRCIDSILRQTLRDIEIILIDDGSKDNSGQIMADYQKRYPGIIKTIYNHINRTTGTSRNIGVSQAEGEYIGFVDADDWIDADFCEKMYGQAKEKNADIVTCGVLRVNENGESKLFFLPPEDWDMELTTENKKKMIVNCFGGMWNNIFRRSIWVEKGFRVLDGLTYNEDMVSVLFLLISKRMATVHEPIYKYWMNPSGNGVFKETVFEEVVSAAKGILMEAKRLEVYDEYKEELFFYILYTVLIDYIPFMEDKKIYERFPYERFFFLLDNVKQMNPDYMKSKYIEERLELRTQLLLQKSGQGAEPLRKYIEHEKEIVAERVESIFLKYRESNVAIWGAGEASRTFLNEYDRNVSKICYVIDKNRELHGRKMPTGHLIVGYEQYLNEIDVILVMKHRHYDEIKTVIGKQAEMIDYERYIYILAD